MKDVSVVETAQMTKYYRGEFSYLTNRTILDVRAMYPEEMELFLWSGKPGAVFLLDDGGLFIPTSDVEGNGIGHLTIQRGKKA